MSSSASSSEANCSFAGNVRILAVDSDPVCLQNLSDILKTCGCQYATATEATEAHEILKSTKDTYDLILIDVKNDLAEFQLAESLNSQMGIPVIFILTEDRTKMLNKDIRYILKPVCFDQIQNLLQNVIGRTNYKATKSSENEIVKPIPSLKRQNDKTSDTKGKRKELCVAKKPRFNWTTELDEKFKDAVNQLGDKASPKNILNVMNVKGLERSNVASHLQKYRQACKSKKEKEQKKAKDTTDAFIRMERRQICENMSCENMSGKNSVIDSNLKTFADGIRANSSTVKSHEERGNNFNEAYSYIASGDCIPMAHVSNSEPTAPSNSSYVPIEIQSSTPSTQMPHPSDFQVTLPQSSSYGFGPSHSFVASQAFQMVQPPNFSYSGDYVNQWTQSTQPLPPPPHSSSYGDYVNQWTQTTQRMPPPHSSSYGSSELHKDTSQEQSSWTINTLSPGSSNGISHISNERNGQAEGYDFLDMDIPPLNDLNDIESFLDSVLNDDDSDPTQLMNNHPCDQF